MGKHSSVKRLSSMSTSTSNGIDIKARKRIEQLFELTDEIINAYNEINEKYVHQIYRKFKQLQDVNKKLREKLNHHHCSGCKCQIQTNGNDNHDDESEHSEEDNDDDDFQSANKRRKTSSLPLSTTSSITTRSKTKNPFIISDIDDTQNFDDNASDNEDKTSMDTDQNTHKTNKNNNNNQSEEEEEEEEDDNEVDEDSGMASLPLALQNIIRRKAKRSGNEKPYLLYIPRYPALCEFLRDHSPKSFDSRPSHDQVRPLITNHLSKYLAKDSKIRIRLRDELREIHRSYMRTFKIDPHAAGFKASNQKNKQLPVKKSPM